MILQDRWKKIPGVQFHHLGQIQFRDTPEEYTLLQVNSERYMPCALTVAFKCVGLEYLIGMPASATHAYQYGYVPRWYMQLVLGRESGPTDKTASWLE